jgi:formate C-acetyltransferase
MTSLAERYAAEAERQASSCADPARKSELEGIAARCRRVPSKPARGFADALQSLWFLYVVLQTESTSACCVGTLDRTLLPYYRADLAAGRIDREEAKLWICHLFAKAYEKNYGDPNDQVQNCTLGGVLADGTSAVNELSWLILEAAHAMGNVGLQVSIRWSRAVEPAFVRAALGLMRDGRFMPQLFNDDLYVPGIESYGVAHEDAVRYALFGCHEPVIAGMSHMRPASYPGYLSAYDWVEDALGLASRRRPALHLERVGPPPEDRAEFERRIFEWMRAAVRAAVIDMNRGDRVKAALMPRPAMSLFMRDCLERETEITAGGARYNMTGFQVCGLANAVDAALAVGTLVFGRGEIPMEEYLAAMVDGFAGHEDLRLRILRTTPKYGADSDEADALAARLAEAFIEETKKYRNARGGPFTPGFWSFVSAISIGSRTAAGADGRPAGKPIAHDLDPHPGRATKGATAVANAMTRLPQDRMVNGACSLIELDSGCFKDEESFEKVYRYFTTYMSSGGLNVQMSHVSAEKLEAAQRDPEAFADLVMRVSGYSEFFTRCSPELQEYIVSREKHRLSP